jgi:hypothetical protein
MGASGLIGAPLSGLSVAHFGELVTCTIAGVAMLVLTTAFALLTRIRELE